MKPILFKPVLVRKIIDNQKSQTRRLSGLIHLNSNPNKIECFLQMIGDEGYFQHTDGSEILVKCPYGKIGDILWVRETFVYRPKHDRYYHKADYMEFAPYAHRGWKPSIHMPKKACRLFLKITNIWAERLRDISEEDAIAEGIEKIGDQWKNYIPSLGDDFQFAIPSFLSLWESVHGPDSWEANPWLWVIEFEKTDKPANWPE